MPTDYSFPFWISEAVWNNAFSFEERAGSREPQLYVPSLTEGSLDDVVVGDEIVFEEFDTEVKSFVGLRNFVHTKIQGKDVYIFDNHNHAFYFWWKHLEPGLGNWLWDLWARAQRVKLIHIDQHSDMRVPDMSFGEFCRDRGRDTMHCVSTEQEHIFQYTNLHLNIGNFIVPAMQTGMIDEVVQITGSNFTGEVYVWEDSKQYPVNSNQCWKIQNSEFRIQNGEGNEFWTLSAAADELWIWWKESKETILDLDLDYFAPEMDFISYEDRKQLVREWFERTDLVTIATSPYFMDQERAIEVLRDLFS